MSEGAEPTTGDINKDTPDGPRTPTAARSVAADTTPSQRDMQKTPQNAKNRVLTLLTHLNLLTAEPNPSTKPVLTCVITGARTVDCSHLVAQATKPHQVSQTSPYRSS